MDTTHEQGQRESVQHKLEWSFNPWHDRTGAAWKKPWVSLLLSLAICALFGVGLAYPNYPEGHLARLEQSLDSPELTEAARAEAKEQLAAISRQQENWHWQAAGWGGVAFVLLVGMTAMLYLPVRYLLDGQGVTVFFLGAPNQRRWEHYRNFYAHDTGVHLTTMPKPSGLDPFRGHFLQFKNNRADVVEFINSHMKLRGVVNE